jgi:Ca-activated chloride channel family protein
MGGETTSPAAEIRLLPSQTSVATETETNVDVVVKIVTAESSSTRAPLNLAIVLDRSGSMQSGGKLVNAKAAIQRVVRSLAANDIVHFVVYGSAVKVIFENGSLDEAEKLCQDIAAVKTSGSTNLSGGLQAGVECVKKHAKDTYQNRVFLFSDGLANEGIVKHDELFAMVSKLYDDSGIKISAFGLGKDFDEELMKGVAECAAGTYFFIEGSKAIDKFVSIALGGVLTAVGSDAVLELFCDNSDVSDLSKIYAYQMGAVKLGDLTENNIRQVIANIRVKPQPNNDSLVVFRSVLTYTPTSGGDRVVLSNVLSLKIVDSVQSLVIDEEVELAVAIARAGELDAQMIDLLENGNAEQAQRLSEAQVQLLQPIVDKTHSPIAANLLRQVRSASASLQQEGYSASVKKKIHHQNYQKRRGSYSYISGYDEE